MNEPLLMLNDKYPHTEKIKEPLKDKSSNVQQYGLNYLIPIWHRFADQYADTEELIYDWLNNLDTRKIINVIIESLPETEQNKIEKELKPSDNIVRSKTFEINECVRGDETERQNKYNRQKDWYNYIMNDHVFESEGGRFTKRH